MAAESGTVATVERPAAPKPKRRYRLSAAGRAQKSKHIGKFARAGGLANIAKHGSKGMSKAGKAGGKVQHERYRIMMLSIKPESPQDLRKRRIEAEAAREEILAALVAAAKEKDAKTETISAALRELRTESDRLKVRESEAIAAEAAAGGSARPVVQPVTVADPAAAILPD